MINLVNVNKYFNRHRKNQVHVIDNTSLKLDNHGLVAFLGHSGSGKTTLLNIIGGLDKFQKGKFYIDGKKITKFNYYEMDKIRNAKIGYIFQDYKLIDTLTVYDNIALVLKMIGIKNKKEIKKRVDYVLEKTGMYRYRNRMANMLSGGERQRVGIARALAKNPDIILADEPTGNLDSKNSIEIMNIIKSISKNRLVILVTHEIDLANFYADRIVKIEDGKVIEDKKNDITDDLDYRMDNTIYLKDFKKHKKLTQDDMNINVYSDREETTDIDIVFKNGNIYIRSNGHEKIELIDDNSSIELVNDHYKKINKKIYEDYDFNLDSVANSNQKIRYSSIYNPVTLIINGFKKVFNYSFIKKLLLIGFFLTGLFMIYSVSSMYAAVKVNEKDFIKINKNYLSINIPKLTVDEYNEFSNIEGVNYILLNDSKIGFKITYKDYYQTSNNEERLSGSLSSINMITKDDLIYGRMPENNHEIVIDKMVYDKLKDDGMIRFVGITDASKVVDLPVYNKVGETFKIVGVTDLISPSIYAYEDIFNNLIINSVKEDDLYAEGDRIDATYLDYHLLQDKINITKGRMPENDYEVIVHEENQEAMKLNKEIDAKINDKKLKVVGYYRTQYDYRYYFVNENTLKYNLISTTKKLTVYPQDKESVIAKFREKQINIQDSYKQAKDKYINSRKDDVMKKLVVAIVIILISLVEIFLMIRSSFLSRIKEIGILRAIGVKKTDIIKMFLGEIIAIATIGGLIGILFMAYMIKFLLRVSYLKNMFVLNPQVILISIILMYSFNIIVGLIPVFNVLRKTPAQILSRHDIE